MFATKRRIGSRAVLPLLAASCLLTGPGASAAKEPASKPPRIQLAQHRSDDRPAAEVRDAATSKTSEQAESTEVAVVYRPPRRGAPSVNVGAGGVRGASAQARPLALAPDHVGLTVHASPSLFWHIDSLPSDDLDVVFTLIDADGVKPLVERKLPSPPRAGIQRVRLDRLGVKLRPGVDYEWSIALLSRDGAQSQVAVTVGYLRRVAPESASPAGRRDGAAYAQAGLWYDALGAFGDAIDAQPNDTDLRSMRNSLLRQAKLETAVE